MASSTDYTIHPTDPNKSPFTIKAYSTNGPLTPSAALPLYTSAVTANSPLVLLGQGMFHYGEPLANDFYHLLENFAYSTAPAYAVQGQLWYNSTNHTLNAYDGANWSALLQDGHFNGPLDMNHQRIINVSDPVGTTDVVNLEYLQANYLPLSGGQMGPLSRIILPTGINPLTTTDVVTRGYVDNQISTIVTNINNQGGNFVSKTGTTGITGAFTYTSGSVILNSTSLALTATSMSLTNTMLTTDGTITLNNGIIAFTNNAMITGNVPIAGNLVVDGTSLLTGDVTTTNNLTINGVSHFVGTVNTNNVIVTGTSNFTGLATATNLVVTGTSILDGLVSAVDVTLSGALTLSADPVLAMQATTKQYVDHAISTAVGTSGADGTVSSASYDPINGILTLNRSVGTSINVLGFLTADQVTNTGSSGTENDTYAILQATAVDSWLATTLNPLSDFPNPTIQETINQIDIGLSDHLTPRNRYINTTTTGQLTIPLGFNYVYNRNALHISINGVKLYSNTHGNQTVSLTNGTKIVSSPSLALNTAYHFTLHTDGGSAQNISFTLVNNISFTITQITSSTTFTVTGNQVNQAYIGQTIHVTCPTPYDVCNGNYTIASLTFDGTNTVIGISLTQDNHIGLIPGGAGIFPSGVIVPMTVFTYVDLVNKLNALMTGTYVIFDRTPALLFISQTSGSISSVSLTDGNLFSTLSGTINTAVPGVSYDYTEVGTFGTPSTSITLNYDPGTGNILEAIELR